VLEKGIREMQLSHDPVRVDVVFDEANLVSSAGLAPVRALAERAGLSLFHGCYSLADDQLWGVVRRRKGGDHTLAALKSIRALRPDGTPIYVILDNLSGNTTPAVRRWAGAHNVELCLTPTYSPWANPIEAQFGPLRTFTMANSNTPTTPS
jgi:hypothetical protein